ncbi:MAG: GAF domain-containing protein [Anaerolineales bacterium]|nr:GAF domain-containing protein [Anaerolineales bacterium]
MMAPPHYPVQQTRLERLLEINRTLASTLEQALLLRNIINAARELIGAEAASIMLADTQSGELRFEAATNMESSQMAGLVVPINGSIAGWIFTHREPVIVPDTSIDTRWHRKVDDKTAFVTRSIMGVPLIHRNKAIGVVQCLNKVDGTFDEGDTATLQALADQAAIAIVNARLFQQSDQISELVHELRTPLGAILATTHLLMRNITEEKRTELIKTIQRETERLSTLTTEFLDISRLESGRIQFKREPFALPELLAESLEVVRHQAQARALGLELRLAPDVSLVVTDRAKIKQVVLNLLTNAVKYNRDEGRITLSAGTTPEGLYRIAVTDTGRGIPPDSLNNLFQKFYRVPESEGSASGTGLGLSLARKIVELLGGEMGVESTYGVGSTFWFTLPAGGE